LAWLASWHGDVVVMAAASRWSSSGALGCSVRPCDKDEDRALRFSIGREREQVGGSGWKETGRRAAATVLYASAARASRSSGALHCLCGGRGHATRIGGGVVGFARTLAATDGIMEKQRHSLDRTDGAGRRRIRRCLIQKSDGRLTGHLGMRRKLQIPIWFLAGRWVRTMASVQHRSMCTRMTERMRRRRSWVRPAPHPGHSGTETDRFGSSGIRVIRVPRNWNRSVPSSVSGNSVSGSGNSVRFRVFPNGTEK
jgi:hypothetical protein